MQTEIEVNENDFEQEVIVKSKQVPVAVDFWAEWCGPCKMLGPTLDKIAKEYNGKFILAKLDVQANQSTARKYEIRSIPCVKLFKNGEIIDEFIGALSEDDVKEWLDKNLK